MKPTRQVKRHDGTGQFYVDGYGLHCFSTEADARAAIALAEHVSRNDREDMAGAFQPKPRT